LYEKTIIVFLADHGRAMVRGKQWPYESGLHIPLIIRWPEEYPSPPEFARGSVDDRLVASIDLTATTIDWAGHAKPDTMQGRVFWGENREPDRDYVFAGRDRGDETVDRIRTVRDARYRYIRNFYPERPFTQINRYKEASYPVLRLMHRLHEAGELKGAAAALMSPTRPREELYDLKNDPYELDNLAADPDQSETVARLREVLENWIHEIDDQGRFPESPDVIEAFERDMRRNYEQRLEQLRRDEANEK
ncbi:MAG: sulfatase-like hydrolase/transferase, partial [Planctomycetaceae bacterium]|nr:sulfatase-like hydrolase/transferase [Planctomycetaceae bacterium]